MMRKNLHLENLMEKIVRNKIFEDKYYKEHCFGLNAETIIDKAFDLICVGGTYGGIRKPTKFLCLIFKMLQINVNKQIVHEYINNEHYKYLTILGSFYLRLVGKPKEIYLSLEPLLLDFRKIRVRLPSGKYLIKRIDEIINDLLKKKFYFDTNLPVIPSRIQMETSGKLPERISPIVDFIDPSEFIVDDEKNKRKNLNRLIFKNDDIDLQPKQKKQKLSNKKEESMSIIETNKLRQKLGLKPLNV